MSVSRPDLGRSGIRTEPQKQPFIKVRAVTARRPPSSPLGGYLYLPESELPFRVTNIRYD